MVQKKNKKTKAERARRFAKWFWIAVSIPVAAVVIIIIMTAYGAFGKLPTFEELENPRNSLATVLYSEDSKPIGSYFEENRTYVDFDDLSPYLVQGLIATEDARYYSHSGVDFIALARVAFRTVLMGSREQGGGSTITQQLAKNLFPRQDFAGMNKVRKMWTMLTIKFKEWITAVKLEYNYTKEEIITMYFNTVFYGSNSHGIKAAARTFYDKEPWELNLTESATLVGVVNAPTRYNPVRNPDNSISRRNTVMTRMEDKGYITRAELDSLKQVPLNLNYTPSSHDQGAATYFREMIRLTMTAQKPRRENFAQGRRGRWDYEQELLRWESNPIYGWCVKNTKADGSPYNIYVDGLKIYTTLDSRMQQYAEEALHAQIADEIQPALDRQTKRTGTLFNDMTGEQTERIIQRELSPRIRHLRQEGATDNEIEQTMRTPVKMRVFTYAGAVDTLLSPRDSVLHYKSIMRAAFMAMDPTTGYVKAYVGGPDFRFFKYDMVKQGRRQIGSTVKPFVYTFAIDYMGYNPCTLVPNLEVTLEGQGKPWTPKEAGRVTYDGVLHPLRWGLAKSRNNYSAWIMKNAGKADPVAKFIHQLGIHSYIDPVDALCLGPDVVSLFEMVGAYSTFANRGVFIEPIFVTRIEDRQGNVIATFTPATSDAINEQTAYTMLEMLKNVARPGNTAARLSWKYGFSDMDIGGKTGTSQDNKDAWFMGVTPKLVGGAWVGGEDESVRLVDGGEGSALALPIFGEFMKRVYADRSLGIRRTDKFYRPLGAVDYDCPDSVDPDAQQGTTIRKNVDEFFD